jgi:hypothetical protein
MNFILYSTIFPNKESISVPKEYGLLRLFTICPKGTASILLFPGIIFDSRNDKSK